MNVIGGLTAFVLWADVIAHEDIAAYTPSKRRASHAYDH